MLMLVGRDLSGAVSGDIPERCRRHGGERWCVEGGCGGSPGVIAVVVCPVGMWEGSVGIQTLQIQAVQVAVSGNLDCHNPLL